MCEASVSARTLRIGAFQSSPAARAYYCVTRRYDGPDTPRPQSAVLQLRVEQGGEQVEQRDAADAAAEQPAPRWRVLSYMRAAASDGLRMLSSAVLGGAPHRSVYRDASVQRELLQRAVVLALALTYRCRLQTEQLRDEYLGVLARCGAGREGHGFNTAAKLRAVIEDEQFDYLERMVRPCPFTCPWVQLGAAVRSTVRGSAHRRCGLPCWVSAAGV